MKEEKGYPLDNPAKSSPQGRKKSPERILQEKREEKKRKSKRWGTVVTVLQGLVSAAFAVILFVIDILPFKYMAVALLALFILFAITYATQKRRKLHVLGKMIGVLVSVVLLAGTYGLAVTNMAFDSVVGGQKKKNDVIVSVTQETFHVYINDNGVYKIATVNPQTHQVLITTTPAEYYISLPGISEGKKDILKNAEGYGTDAVMKALGTLYEIEIPFYAEMKLENLREMAEDVTPNMVIRPDKLVSSVGKNIETNLTKRQIQQLMKLYLGEDSDWEVHSVHAKGSNSSNHTYSDPDKVSFVIEPDKDSVLMIIDLVKKVETGEKLKASDVKK